MYTVLALSGVHESPWNPRTRYDQAELDKLADSIRAKGVMTPIQVRPRVDKHGLTSGYEVAAGHRRRRAALLAGLIEIPALVKPMDDEAFLELLTFENDEREDLHPLEEATGYRQLMERAGWTPARLAERRGLPIEHIRERLRLLALIKPAQTLFLAGRFLLGHANVLAKLTPADQVRATKPPSDRASARHGELGLWAHDLGLFDDEADDAEAQRKKDPYAGLKPVSVKELERWVAEHVRFDVRAASLPELFPATAEVLAAAEAVEETVVKITHEGFVQPEGRDPKERTIGPRSWERADGRHGSKACEHAVTGVIAIGPGRGEAFKVCIAKDKCDVHWKALRAAAKKRAKDHATGRPDKPAPPAKKHPWEIEQEHQRAAAARYLPAVPSILEAVAAAVKKAPTRAGGLLGAILIKHMDATCSSVANKDKGLVPRGATADDLVRHLAWRLLEDEATEYDAARTFPKRMKAFGVDVAKLVAAAAPKEEKTPEPAKAAPKAKKKARKKTA